MKKLFATTLIAGAIALNPMASAPAHAGDAKDALGVIIGLAALAAIANEIDNNRTTRHSGATRNAIIIRNHNRARVLPAQCVRRFDTNQGPRNILRARCLERNGIRTARLPDRCERTIQTRRGFGTGFAARCLQRQGFAIR